MKNFFIKGKTTIFLCFIIIILLVSIFFKSFGMEQVEETPFSLGIVNTDFLNMRTGPNITFKSIDVLKKNEYIRIIGKIGDWYIIQNEENLIGTSHSKYIDIVQEQKSAVTNSEIINDVENDKVISETNVENSVNNLGTSSNINTNTNNSTESINSILSKDEQELFDLINNERKANNLQELKLEEELQNVAKLKAEDIVKNSYFSHISPTYGTPYEMLKTFNISYKTGSENIAGNTSIKSAFDSFMNSESHKNNILSNEYNFTGIGVVDSIAYGKIIVELFIGR